jgi:Putative auto-transporter adhesin, head GIN domain
MQSCMDCVTGAGDNVEEERIVTEFSAIDVQCSADIIIKDRILSDKNKVVVKAQANILPMIVTRVIGNKLVIDMEGCIMNSNAIEVYVYVNEISEINLGGSGNIRSENALRGDVMEINLSGSGNINLMLRTNVAEVNLNGSGDIKLDGTVNKAEFESHGSGDIEAASLKSERATVSSHGSGDISVNASEEMELNLNGSGNILYSGRAEKIKQNDNGSGEIHESH